MLENAGDLGIWEGGSTILQNIALCAAETGHSLAAAAERDRLSKKRTWGSVVLPYGLGMSLPWQGAGIEILPADTSSSCGAYRSLAGSGN